MAEPMRLFQEACRNFHEESAHRFLSEFPKRPEALWVTQQLLTLAPNAETYMYQFQATIALRQSIVLHWNTLSDDQRHEVQNFVVQSILRFAENTEKENPILKLLCGVAAIVFKLRWKTIDSRTAFLDGVMQLVKEEKEAFKKYAGLIMLQAIVEELNGATATPLELSVDYHKQCSAAFQKAYLCPFFVECIYQMSCLTQSGRMMQPDAVHVSFACIRTLNSMLLWDFDQSQQIGSQLASIDTLRPRSDHAVLGPESVWLDVLADERLVSWLSVMLTDAIPHTHPSVQSAAYIEEATEFLVHLCSIRSSTFRANAKGAPIKKAFLKHLLQQLLPFLLLNDRLMDRPESLMLVGRAFDALARQHPCSDILQAAEELSARKPLMDSLRWTMNALLDSGSMSADKTDTPEQQCCLQLLNVWEKFCSPEVNVVYKGVKQIGLCDGVSDCAKDIFQHILSSELQFAEINAMESEKSSLTSECEILLMYAQIGRASPAFAFDLLSQHLISHKRNLDQLSDIGETVSDADLERIAFLAEISAYVLADDVEGEDPTLPPEIAEFSQTISLPNEDPTITLSYALLNLRNLVSNASVRQCISGRVVECIAQALAQWTETYLIPDAVTTPTLMEAFGINQKGQHTVQELCEFANVCITVFPAEYELQKIVCDRLLRALTRSGDIRQRVLFSPAWMELHHAFAEMYPVFQQMHHKMGRHIAFALCLASDAHENEAERRRHLTRLVDPIGREVHRLSTEGGRATYGCFLLEVLRGIVQASQGAPESREILYGFFDQLLGPLLNTLAGFRSDALFTSSVLKLAAEIVNVYILYVKEQEAARMLHWVLEILKMYADHQRGVTSIEVSKLLQQEKEHEQCKNIRAILVLLKNVTDRELTADESPKYLDIAQIILQGMDLTIPLMTTEMLKFPKICFRYFDLLSHLCDMYPEKVMQLPAASRQMLMSTLVFGIHLPESRALRLVMESLASLARHLYEQSHGTMAPHTVSSDPSFAKVFIEAILQRLMSGDEEGEAVRVTSETLLLLFICERENLQHHLRQLISSIGCYPSMDNDIHAFMQFHEKRDRDLKSSKTQEQFQEQLFAFVKNLRSMTRRH